MPGLGAGDLLLFRLPPRGLDVELRTVRDLGFVGPASVLMFEGDGVWKITMERYCPEKGDGRIALNQTRDGKTLSLF